jgi:uncharacterized protein (DUF1810 family)
METMVGSDSFDLDRFMTAQATVFDTALEELKNGRKQTHWMWFIFPQMRDLGYSSMARFYGIGSLDEARAYLAHPILGPRLKLCVEAVLGHQELSLHTIFGSPDDLKFRSCMTLYANADREENNIFHQAIGQCCNGEMDERTLALL